MFLAQKEVISGSSTKWNLEPVVSPGPEAMRSRRAMIARTAASDRVSVGSPLHVSYIKRQ